MRRIITAVFLVLLGFFSSCLGVSPVHTQSLPSPTSIPCPPRHIRVSFDPMFAYRAQDLGALALNYLTPLGVTAEVVTDHPDVRIVYWLGHLCTDGKMGIYTLGTDLVLVDPNCIYSDLQFQAVVAHEIGHWLGMTHVCDLGGLTSDTCSSIGQGRALLNPFLAWDHPADPTVLDIQEYNRVCWIRMYGSSIWLAPVR